MPTARIVLSAFPATPIASVRVLLRKCYAAKALWALPHSPMTAARMLIRGPSLVVRTCVTDVLWHPLVAGGL